MAKIVFMGTPEFACPSLKALLAAHTVVGVVTQPDRPAGRHRQLTASPIKKLARQAGVPIIQPLKLREPETLAQLQAWAPEVIVVVAFGQILKPEVLHLPPHGCVNVHASLLPRHRGAAPIPAALLAGDAETGVTIMHMDVGLDSGPILAQRPTAISPDDTSASLANRLSVIGAELLSETLPAYLAGQLTLQPQDDSRATYAPQLKKEDGRLDFTQPAVILERRVRAMNPWPGAFTAWADTLLKILRTAVVETAPHEPGTVLDTPAGPAVACGTGALLLEEVQPAGRKPLPAVDFVRGAPNFIGARLG